MRITLQADESALPSDCFGCVRIGDEYRLFPFSSNRILSFADMGSKWKRGRIEVFQRIGKSQFDLRSEDQSSQEIRVGIEGGARELQVQLTGSETAADEQDSARRKKQSALKTGAKEYLSSHQLEATLSDAVAHVLKGRPSDPLVALSKYLLETHESRKPEQPSASIAEPPQSKPVLSSEMPDATNPELSAQSKEDGATSESKRIRPGDDTSQAMGMMTIHKQPNLQNIIRQKDAQLYVLYLQNLSLNSSLNHFRNALRTLKSRMPDIPRCRCHWYIKDAHDASKSFGFEETANVAIEYFAFLVVPTNVKPEASATLTVTTTTDNRHLGAHFVDLTKLGDAETSHSSALPLNNQDGIFAQAKVHAAAQDRWTSEEVDENQEQGVRFVDPASDAQARYILHCICRSACAAKQDSSFKLPLSLVLPQL